MRQTEQIVTFQSRHLWVLAVCALSLCSYPGSAPDFLDPHRSHNDQRSSSRGHVSRAALNVNYACHSDASQPPDYNVMASGTTAPQFIILESVVIRGALAETVPTRSLVRTRAPPLV